MQAEPITIEVRGGTITYTAGIAADLVEEIKVLFGDPAYPDDWPRGILGPQPIDPPAIPHPKRGPVAGAVLRYARKRARRVALVAALGRKAGRLAARGY